MRWPATIVACAVLLCAPLQRPAYAADAAFTQFIASLWPEAKAAGVSRETFDRETRSLEPDYKLPDLILPGRPKTGAPAQAEFVQVPADYIKEASIARLAAAARAADIRMLSHDDNTPVMRQEFRALGATIAEFPVNEETARDAAAAGEHVVYGDAARRESLVAAGIHRAAAVAITYADTASALKVLHHVQALEPTLPVIVRTIDDADLDRLQQAGAPEVVPEIIEGSLMLASHALVLLGVPLRRVVRRAQEMRDARYSLLRGYFHGQDDEEDMLERDAVRLHSVPLAKGSPAIGRKLGTMGLETFKTSVTAIRRQGIRALDPDPDTVLELGDIVVLRGTPEGLQMAEERLSPR